MKGTHVSGKGKGRMGNKKLANCDNEALQTKLLEALGLATGSPKALNTKQTAGCQRVQTARHKQESDPARAAFDSPGKNEGGQFSHFSTSKKPPTRAKTKLQHQIASEKKSFQGKNMFTFDQGEGSDTGLPVNSMEQMLPSPVKSSSHSKEKVDFPCPSSKAKMVFMQTSNKVAEESSEDTSEYDEAREMESPPAREEKQAKKHFRQFRDQGFTKPKGWFSNTVSSMKPSSTLHRSKRVHIQEDIKPRKINLSSLSPLDASRTEETMGSREASESNPARTFSQMTSVLDGFNTKLKSHTSKKSSEILSSALDKIRSQLQAIESQIQTDVGKLTNAGKTKRKRFESTVQEQHDRLRLLHEKFKEEVNQHLIGCRNTFEELEAYQTELRGSTERHKASQRKLLMQAEEAVKVQLSEADSCIAAVQKEARKKMGSLKLVLEEWMTEGDEVF